LQTFSLAQIFSAKQAIYCAERKDVGQIIAISRYVLKRPGCAILLKPIHNIFKQINQKINKQIFILF